MKCRGEYDIAGEDCDKCNSFMEDCDGHPDYEVDENGDWKIVEDEDMSDETKTDELRELSKPVIKYLCENYHPHIKVIIEPWGFELVEGLMSDQTINEYMRD